MPRHGVGLNDLLGGPDAGEGKAVASLPRTEARMPGRARELTAGRFRSRGSGEAELIDAVHRFRSRQTQCMRYASAYCTATEEETSR